MEGLEIGGFFIFFFFCIVQTKNKKLGALWKNNKYIQECRFLFVAILLLNKIKKKKYLMV